jgi:hypothetical protein
MRHLLKKGDIVLIGLLFCFTLMSFFFFRYLPQKGSRAIISVDNRERYHLSLTDERDISIEGSMGMTHIRILDGSIWIVRAPCPHKDCMRMGRINRAGEIIVCIPNKIFIEVQGTGERFLDGITM